MKDIYTNRLDSIPTTLVATRHHMVDRAGILDAVLSWHGFPYRLKPFCQLSPPLTRMALT